MQKTKPERKVYHRRIYNKKIIEFSLAFIYKGFIKKWGVFVGGFFHFRTKSYHFRLNLSQFSGSFHPKPDFLIYENKQNMDLQKIGTTELIKLKNEIVEELHRREMNKTAVIWAIPGEKKKEENKKPQPIRAEFYIG